MIFCQACGRANSLEAEYCTHCGQKLLVVSGDYTDEDQEAFESRPEEQLSFDEHLLERISILEEVARRTAQGLHRVLGVLHKLEQKLLVCETGVTSLRDLLENRGVFARQDWSELWESRLDRQLLALEKRDRFAHVKERIRGLYAGDDRARFGALLDEADHALLAFDIDKAIKALEMAAEADPRNHELHFFLGETFFNEGKADAALDAFAQVLAQRPDHFESLVYCGVVCHEQGHAQEAQGLLLRAAERYPDAFLPSFCLGAILAGDGRLDDAIFFLRRATAVREPVPEASYLLGSCLFESGRGKEAIKPLERAVEKGSTLADAHFLLGLAYLERGWHRKAREPFHMALRLEPPQPSWEEIEEILGPEDLLEAGDEAAPLLAEARELLRQGSGAEALALCRRGLALGKDGAAAGREGGEASAALLLGYAMACAALRKSDVAANLRKAVALARDERLRVAASAALIAQLRADGRWRESAEAAERLLAEAATPLSRCVGSAGLAAALADAEEELERALDAGKAAAAEAPDRLRRQALGALGWVHYRRGELDDALHCLTAANDLGSTARLLTHLGMTLLAAGDKKGAREVLERARAARGPQGLSAGKNPQSPAQARLLETLKNSTRLLREAGHRLDS